MGKRTTMNPEITILIVDDEPVSRELLHMVLSRQGYTLISASDGEECLIQAAKYRPDLILLDVMLPGMSGFEVCQRLRADTILAEVPIILITALDDRASRLQGIEAGADDFITKPVDKLELRKRVQTITRLDRYRQLLIEREHRQQAEEEIRRRNQEVALLKEAERLKDQFVSNVSHELRTPLSIITLLSGNLDTLYERLDDEKRRTMIRDIRTHTRALNDLISDVLELSRIDSKTISTQYEQINLVELVRDEIHEQIPLAQSKTQNLTLHNGDEAVMVCGNRGQIRQVIRNLINNAVKYTPEHGSIWCECRIYVDSDDSNGAAMNQPKATSQDSTVWPGVATLPAGAWAALRVVDEGIGIHEEDIPHLFDRFFRVNSQTNIPGTGLGLSIAHDLVTLHNGHIALASNPGQGSVFAFYLPLQEEEQV
jgi:signal transduction histidine kinase